MKFEVRHSPIHGRGVFATQRLRKGTRLIEYTGERVTPEAADERYDDDEHAHPHTFLFTINEHLVIDASVGGNAARFINHSCDPNCEAVDEDGRIYIHTLRTIQPGEELTYDYRLERDSPWRRDFAKRYECHCGAANCRGVLLIKPVKPGKKKRG